MNTKQLAIILLSLAIFSAGTYATQDFVMATYTATSTGATGGGGGSGGSGGGGGSAGPEVVETIYEGSLTDYIEPADLVALLIEAGYSSEQAEEAKAIMGKVLITQTLKIEKTTGGGPTTYKSTITITVKNPSNMDYKDLKVVVEIPKEIAADVSEITSAQSFATLKADPIIAFTLDILSGESQTITWSVAKEITTYQRSLIKAPVTASLVEQKTCKGVDCDDSNSCTSDSCVAGNCTHENVAEGTVCGTGMVCKAGQCAAATTGGVTIPPGAVDWGFWIIVIVIILIIAGAAYYYFYVMEGAKERRKKLASYFKK